MPKRAIEDFISHWSAASPSERANSQPFLIELCDLLDVPHPDPHPANGYFFEFPVVEHHADGTNPSIFKKPKPKPLSLNLPPGKLDFSTAKSPRNPCAARRHGMTP
jgi:hypothetical protein